MYERECYGGGFDLVVTVVLYLWHAHTLRLPAMQAQCASNQERACARVSVCGVEREQTIG